jgi:hypothetical protein
VSNGQLQLTNRLALTVAEAADAVGVSERSLRQMLPMPPQLGLFGEDK